MRSTMTVTTPNTAVALTTLTRVKAELGILEADTSKDTILNAKISEASSDIEGHINRTLRQETLTQVFWGLRGCVEALILDRYPVASITSVTIDDELLDLAQTRIDKDSGLLYRLTDSGAPTSWSFGKSISVAFVAGYKMPDEEEGRDLPPALEAACVELVSSYWSSRGRDPTVREEDIPGVIRKVYWVGAVGGDGELPPTVEAKIAPWRRPVLG